MSLSSLTRDFTSLLLPPTLYYLVFLIISSSLLSPLYISLILSLSLSFSIISCPLLHRYLPFSSSLHSTSSLILSLPLSPYYFLSFHLHSLASSLPSSPTHDSNSHHSLTATNSQYPFFPLQHHHRCSVILHSHACPSLSVCLYLFLSLFHFTLSFCLSLCPSPF